MSERSTALERQIALPGVVEQAQEVREAPDAQGKLRINPRKAGLITITAREPNRSVCGPKRVGVVGVFLPPLTG